MTQAVTDIARALMDARTNNRPIPPISGQLEKGGLDAAYLVQAMNNDAFIADGRVVSGRKIGLTSKTVQQQLGVDYPDTGMLFADMLVADGDSVAAGRLIQPRAEAEIAYILSRDILDVTEDRSIIADAVDHAVAAIEIVDSAIADWNINILDTVADNASCGLYVLGNDKKRLNEFDQRLCGMVLSLNGTITSVGTGAACLDHPLNAVMWLANHCVRAGRPLKAGEVILSGALGPMITMQRGDDVMAEIGGLGAVSVSWQA